MIVTSVSVPHYFLPLMSTFASILNLRWLLFQGGEDFGPQVRESDRKKRKIEL